MTDCAVLVQLGPCDPLALSTLLQANAALVSDAGYERAGASPDPAHGPGLELAAGGNGCVVLLRGSGAPRPARLVVLASVEELWTSAWVDHAWGRPWRYADVLALLRDGASPGGHRLLGVLPTADPEELGAALGEALGVGAGVTVPRDEAAAPVTALLVGIERDLRASGSRHADVVHLLAQVADSGVRVVGDAGLVTAEEAEHIPLDLAADVAARLFACFADPGADTHSRDLVRQRADLAARRAELDALRAGREAPSKRWRRR